MRRTKASKFEVTFYSGHDKDLLKLMTKLAEKGFGVPYDDLENPAYGRLEYRTGGLEIELFRSRATILAKGDLNASDKRFMQAVHSEYWWNNWKGRENFILQVYVIAATAALLTTYLASH